MDDSKKKEDVERYGDVIKQIKFRLDAADELLTGLPQTIRKKDQLAIEHAALELRLVLELIVLGSLVTNREAISKVSSVFKIDGASEARKAVEAVNSDYWPQPITRYRLTPAEGPSIW